MIKDKDFMEFTSSELLSELTELSNRQADKGYRYNANLLREAVRRLQEHPMYIPSEDE